MPIKKISKKINEVMNIVKLRKAGNGVHWSAKINNTTLQEKVIVSHNASLVDTKVGSYSSIGRYSKISNTNIGKYCSISWDVTIGATSHPLGHLSTHAFPYVPYAGGFVATSTQHKVTTTICNDVWIGCNSVIMPGITISNGAVVGAGSVVTKDVPPYAIVAGVPAKIIKYRFHEDIVNELLLLKWWDIEPKLIRENIEFFQKDLDKELINKFKKKVMR